MSDPLAREIGRVEDFTGLPLTVGVDHGAVSVGSGAARWRFTAEQADELAALLITALWQAERDAAHGGDECRAALFARAREDCGGSSG